MSSCHYEEVLNVLSPLSRESRAKQSPPLVWEKGLKKGREGELYWRRERERWGFVRGGFGTNGANSVYMNGECVHEYRYCRRRSSEWASPFLKRGLGKHFRKRNCRPQTRPIKCPNYKSLAISYTRPNRLKLSPCSRQEGVPHAKLIEISIDSEKVSRASTVFNRRKRLPLIGGRSRRRDSKLTPKKRAKT